MSAPRTRSSLDNGSVCVWLLAADMTHSVQGRFRSVGWDIMVAVPACTVFQTCFFFFFFKARMNPFDLSQPLPLPVTLSRSLTQHVADNSRAFPADEAVHTVCAYLLDDTRPNALNTSVHTVARWHRVNVPSRPSTRRLCKRFHPVAAGHFESRQCWPCSQICQLAVSGGGRKTVAPTESNHRNRISHRSKCFCIIHDLTVKFPGLNCKY